MTPEDVLAGMDSSGRYAGDLNLEGYKHPLPAKLTGVRGILDLNNYSLPLPPALQTVEGSLFVGNRKPPVYKHPLPPNLSSVRGDLDVRGYEHPLPESLTYVEGALLLNRYKHPLPQNLVVVGEIVGAQQYKRKLPYQPEVLSEHYTTTVPTGAGFKKWFAKSRARTSDGRPILLYHGTENGGFSQFHPPESWFTSDLRQAATYTHSQPQTGYISDPTPAIGMADVHGKDGVYRVWLSLQNPLIVDANGAWWHELNVPEYPSANEAVKVSFKARRDGYDGVIFRSIRAPRAEMNYGEPADVYVVFDPTQIKSALFNQGTYDPKDPDIRKNPRRRTSRPGKSRRKTSRSKRKTSRS